MKRFQQMTLSDSPAFSRRNQRCLLRCLSGRARVETALVSLATLPTLPGLTSLKMTAPLVLKHQQGATKRGVNRVQSHIARCRLDDTSPCPERQVEKLSVLLWPVQKGGSF
jgi:hypothetical protein